MVILEEKIKYFMIKMDKKWHMMKNYYKKDKKTQNLHNLQKD